MIKPIKVVIAEEQEILLAGLCQIIEQMPEVKVIATTGSWEELLDLINESTKPDILLINTGLPQFDLALLKKLKSELAETQFIALTIPDYTMIQHLIGAGVIGFLAPGFDNQQLIRSIEISAKKEVFLHPHVAKEIIDGLKKVLVILGADPRDIALLNKLTPREKEVLTLVTQGYGNTEIGLILFISPKTVRSHVKNILDKLGFSDRIQAAIFAIRTGMINIGESPDS